MDELPDKVKGLDMEPVQLEEIRDSAIRIAIRLDLGDFQVGGPQKNILELESRVAWATVTMELQKEGYLMIAPEEYATAYDLDPAEVSDRIEKIGSLFAIIYTAVGETYTVVPESEREEREHLGPIPR
jgi:hypothetical protein